MVKQTSVHFQTSNALLAKLVGEAERKSLSNIKDFDGRKVLIEGGGYEKIWLETQPMGGEMYAKRNMEVGINNQLLFMEHAREDGRIPGSIAMIDGKRVAQFNKFQGFCFPAHALNMYYLMGCDDYYLEFLYTTLEKFDAYLWKVRDSDGDGCLESWCKYDTGEDHAERYGDAPDAWEEETPPQGYKVVPMASIDIMSYSYHARETLEQISWIMSDRAARGYRSNPFEMGMKLAEFWRLKADQVKAKIESYLWNDQVGACLDRDKNHQVLPTLMHNTLRAMYFNSISQEKADRFVKEHLLNPEEFWTPMPLPSVAVNDPLFRNITTNNWSGQAEALTYQRAIRALGNYGYDNLIPELGNKLFQAIGFDCNFVQQYDPFTMEPSKVCLEGEQDGYGPAMLSVLEYTARMYGIHIERDKIYWGCVGGVECEYEQQWGDRHYFIRNDGQKVEAMVDGKVIFGAPVGQKVITDYRGNILKSISLE
ncbi:MAG: hypothetical protein IJW63_05245 [Lachnospiraceae bacterium]|nr:hypothetical protein [Lachnospiraceae bacterium]